MSAEDLHLDLSWRRAGFTLELAERIPARGVTGVFGPSGSGKTSLLRMIAGFETPDHGEIGRGTSVWARAGDRKGLAAHKRRIGYVSQNADLFEHLDVAGNLDFAAHRSGLPADRRAGIINALELDPLLQRRTSQLSGGETQRVALGRALMSDPDLLMFDEPLSALDRGRRSRLLTYIREGLAEFDGPVLYVSHDLEEMLALTDRVILLESGSVRAHGETASVLAELLAQTETGEHAAGVLTGVIQSHDPDLALSLIAIANDVILLPGLLQRETGEPVRLRVAARDVILALKEPTGLSIRNRLQAEISAIEADSSPAFSLIRLKLGGEAVLTARLTRAAVQELGLKPGLSVFALIKTASLASP